MDARDAFRQSLIGKATDLGALPSRDGEPEWVRLLLDLHELRVWRREHLDRYDQHLPPTLMGAGDMFQIRVYLFPAYRAWAEARGVRLNPITDEVRKLAYAGFLPGVSKPPEWRGWTLQVRDHEESFEKLVAEKGAAKLRDEIQYAYRVLPELSFPVPSDKINRLLTRIAAEDGVGWTIPGF